MEKIKREWRVKRQTWLNLIYFFSHFLGYFSQLRERMCTREENIDRNKKRREGKDRKLDQVKMSDYKRTEGEEYWIGEGDGGKNGGRRRGRRGRSGNEGGRSRIARHRGEEREVKWLMKIYRWKKVFYTNNYIQFVASGRSFKTK